MAKQFNRDVNLAGGARLMKGSTVIVDADGNIDAPVTTTNLTTSGNTTLGDSSADTLSVPSTSTFSAPVTIGVDDTGHDVTFFGATAGKKFLWDESADSLIITSATAAALAVGANGGTNPAFVVDASTASSATGFSVKSAAAAGGVLLQVLSSDINESATINAKGTGTLTLQSTATGGIIMGQNLIMGDAKNIVINTTTGTQIGTGSTQKIGFWGAVPILQPNFTGTTSGFTAGAGSNVLSDSTFTGGVGSRSYTIGDIVKHLKDSGLVATN